MSERPPAVPPPDTDEASSRLGMIARGGVLMFAGSVIEAAVGMAGTVVITQLLGEADFGVYSLGVSAIGLNVILYELGLPTAVMRWIAVFDGEGDSAGARGVAIGGSAVCGALGTVGAVLLCVFAHPIADVAFHKPRVASILPLMALQLPLLSSMAAMLRVTQARGTMRPRVLVEKIILPVARLAIISLLVGLGGGLVGAALGAAISTAVAFTFAAYFAWGIARHAWGAVKPRWELRRLLTYAVPLLLSALALFARRRGIVLTLGNRGSEAQTGVYAAADRAALTSSMGLNAVASIFGPLTADLHNRGQHEELHGLLKTGAAWTMMIVIPITVPLVVCPAEVMAVFGKGFPEGAMALALLAGAFLVTATFGQVDTVFAMCNKQWLALVDLAFFAVVSIVVAYLLIPGMGIVGAAIAGVIGLAGPRTTRLIEVWLLMRMSPFGPEQTRVLLWGLPATFALIASRWGLARSLAPLPCLLVSVSAFMAVYGATVSLGAREEVERLLDAIRHRRARRSLAPGSGPRPDALDDQDG